VGITTRRWYVLPALIFSTDRTADGKFISVQKHNTELTLVPATFVINLTFQAVIMTRLSAFYMCELRT
jgi:hypothetical protein